MNIISNNDAMLKDILFEENSIDVVFLLWNGLEKKVHFDECYGINIKMAINEEIGDIYLTKETSLIQDITKDFESGDGENTEISLSSIVFKDSWNERIILEICSDEKIIQEIYNTLEC